MGKPSKPVSCWVDAEFPGGAYHLLRMSDFRTERYTIGIGQTVFADTDGTAHIAPGTRHTFRCTVRHLTFATEWSASREFRARSRERAAATPAAPASVATPRLTDEEIAAVRKRYTASTVPPCHICGQELSLQAVGGGPAVWACDGYIGADGERRLAEGRRPADDHYGRSRHEQYRTGDGDVLAALVELVWLRAKMANIESAMQACAPDVPTPVMAALVLAPKGVERPGRKGGGDAG